MKDRWDRFKAWMHSLDPRVKVVFGVLFVLLGLSALVTPLTPGSWLIFIGLELLGIRILAWRKVAKWLGKSEGSASEDSER